MPLEAHTAASDVHVSRCLASDIRHIYCTLALRMRRISTSCERLLQSTLPGLLQSLADSG